MTLELGTTVTGMRMWVTRARDDDSGLELALSGMPVPPAGGMGQSAPVISVRDQERYQTIDGFGASITQATATLWNRHLTEERRAALLTDLFDPAKGIGLTLLRQPVGPSDHVTRPYSFLRRLPDPRLKSLDFSYEEREILPMVVAARDTALAGGRDLRVIASAWSAPWWMKTNLHTLGVRPWLRVTGRLRRRAYGPYAEYLARFAETYERHGVPVFGITPVNEPDNAQSLWPSMAMSPREQAAFIARHLRPALDRHGLGDARIMCWDHNYSTGRHPKGAFVRELYADRAALAACDGSAWHYYGGSARTMSEIHEAWPDKGIWVTEASGGDWGPRNWRSALMGMARRTIAMLGNWAQAVLYWNVALDTEGGPDHYYLKNQRRHSQNRGLVTVNRGARDYIRNADYYVIGHVARFVLPGSVRVGLDLPRLNGLHAVAFIRPDGRHALVALNERPVARRFALAGHLVEFPASSLSTLVW